MQYSINLFSLDPDSNTPLFRQIYQEMRDAILSSRLPSGSKLPSTRQLAGDLGVSRNTVLNAYEQLLAEGYINGHRGSGHYVSKGTEDRSQPQSAKRNRILSRRGKVVAQTTVSIPVLQDAKLSLRPGTPALEKFPFGLWGKLLTGSLHQLRARDFHYSDPAGYRPLRQAIARYLGRNRGVQCDADRIVIVNGSQQALDLCGKVLLNAGETAWLEDPGYKGARAAIQGAGARIISVPVDDQGLQWSKVRDRRPPRFIYITPSHQFPMGVTMSLQRRLALLELASQNKSWILEDDYDSEFRYDGRPLAALQGLDRNNRVLYIGTFSKVLFAGLRLGYLVVPPDLHEAFVNAKAMTDRHCPILEQAAVAEFVSSGRFDRHIRNMRKVYAKRQQKLVDSVNHILPHLLTVLPAPAGMHLIGWLPEHMEDQVVSRRMAEERIEIPALSSYSIRKVPPGLLLGYSALTPQRMAQALTVLASVLRQL